MIQENTNTQTLYHLIYFPFLRSEITSIIKKLNLPHMETTNVMFYIFQQLFQYTLFVESQTYNSTKPDKRH